MTDRVLIFDTTLRDGEQSPGFSMNAKEKLEMAKQLAALGVDIIEAGFPISSPGDLDSVQQIARDVRGPVIAGLARQSDRCGSRLEGRAGGGASSHPHIYCHIRNTHEVQTAADAE